MASNSMPITVEFTGGLEILFSNQRTHKVVLPLEDEDGNAVTVAFLTRYLCKNVMKGSRKEMFILDGSVWLFYHTASLPYRFFLPISAHDGTEIADIKMPDYSRPGILVLINDVDWELEGEEGYQIQRDDSILFVSTLHGG